MRNKIDLVNSKIGTFNSDKFSNGNIFPIVSVPFGMVNFTIQTDKGKWAWFYSPLDRIFEGFRLTHQPSPWVGDYGHMTFFPFVGNLDLSSNDRHSSYDPEEGILKPHFMEVYLKRYQITYSLVPTTRGAILKISSNDKKKNIKLSFNIFGETSLILKNNTIEGYTLSEGPYKFKCLKEYLVFKPDQEIVSFHRFDDCYVAEFKASEVEIRLSTSYISLLQAKINFDNELEGLTFEEAKENALKSWEEKLNTIDLSDENIERAKTFYSCLYRVFLYPRIFYEFDINGVPHHYNADLDKVLPGVFFTDNGFWDTYRTVYPLLSILDKETVSMMIEGFVNYGEEVGWLPKWISPGEIGIMPGALVEAVIADAAVKGIISGELLARAYRLLKKNCFEAYGGDYKHGRLQLDSYIKYGYVPNTFKESINNTLDNAYGDFCVAQVAKIVGDNETANILLARSKSYKKLFDKRTKFFRGKDQEGNFRDTFSAIEWGGDNCEGSYWQNSFAVYHDIEGLASLHGGIEQLCGKLDELFSLEPNFEVGAYGKEIHEMSEMAAANFGQCAISNQPSFHIPYLYAYLGQKEKTIYWIRRIVNEAFDADYDGLPGDEDNGSMAAWYIFACLGIYPVCPGRDQFVIGKQMFDCIMIHGRPLRNWDNLNVITTKELF